MLAKFRILIAASVALAAGCALAPSASAIVVHNRTGQFLGVASRPGATIAGSVAAASSAGGASGVAITSYTWSFGDGATGTGAIPSHAYPAPGSYKVKLTVTDAAGARISTTQTVTVLDEPPIAVFGASPAVPIPGQPVTFDGSSSSDPDATIVSYAWDFGDGATATGAAPRDLRLRPAAAGRAQCDDVHGTASGADPTSSYAWSFGDGTTAAGPAVAHAYASDGTYRVTLTVTDPFGLTSSTSEVVTVIDSAPIAAISVLTAHPRVGRAVLLSGARSMTSTTRSCRICGTSATGAVAWARSSATHSPDRATTACR